MTQRYKSETALTRMAEGNCPECGQPPQQHLTSPDFWLPRHCDLTQAGVTDRITAFLEDQLPRCAHCGEAAVYQHPHEIWCTNCGGYFAGTHPITQAIQATQGPGGQLLD